MITKLINIVTVVKDGKATITGDIVQALPHEFKFPARQVTVGHLSDKNIRHHRHLQLSEEALFIKGNGHALAIPHDELISASAKIAPKTSYSPRWKKTPTPDSLTVEFDSELKPELQWMCSDRPETESGWKKIDGATSAALTKTDELKGKWVSCMGSSEAGRSATPPIQL